MVSQPDFRFKSVTVLILCTCSFSGRSSLCSISLPLYTLFRPLRKGDLIGERGALKETAWSLLYKGQQQQNNTHYMNETVQHLAPSYNTTTATEVAGSSVLCNVCGRLGLGFSAWQHTGSPRRTISSASRQYGCTEEDERDAGQTLKKKKLFTLQDHVQACDSIKGELNN